MKTSLFVQHFIGMTLGMLMSGALLAAVPSKLIQNSDRLTSNQVLEALKLPFDNRIQALKSHRGKTTDIIYSLIFDRSQSLDVRWKSLTSLVYIDKIMGQEAVESALAGNEWYLKNAAALALPQLRRDYAIKKSAELLSDPALVIRTAAAQNLHKLKGYEKESLLWEKINAKENFKNGESLWVRRHIAMALADLAKPGREALFIELLKDKDSRLHPLAIKGLARLRGQDLLSSDTGTQSQAQKKSEQNLAFQRQRWLAWWKNQAP